MNEDSWRRLLERRPFAEVHAVFSNADGQESISVPVRTTGDIKVPGH